MTAAKIAVSIPEQTFASLEKARARLGISRSEAITRAIDAWLSARDVSEADKKYAAGYLRQPEPIEETAAIAAETTTTWEPWE